MSTVPQSRSIIIVSQQLIVNESRFVLYCKKTIHNIVSKQYYVVIKLWFNVYYVNKYIYFKFFNIVGLSYFYFVNCYETRRNVSRSIMFKALCQPNSQPDQNRSLQSAMKIFFII